MSEEPKQDLPLLQKIIHTAVLTGVSALILGFFSFFGWLGVTMIKIQDNQTIIMQDLKYKELKESKTVDVVAAELFKAKQRILQLENKDTSKTKSKDIDSQDPFSDTYDTDDNNDSSDAKVELQDKQQAQEIRDRMMQQQQERTHRLKQYQQQLQQQRIIPPQQLK